MFKGNPLPSIPLENKGGNFKIKKGTVRFLYVAQWLKEIQVFPL